jgi:hypothetical protein
MNRFEILKMANKKRSLSVRDFKYTDLEDMVHEGLLNKSLPKRGRGAGWPAYALSHKGRRSLKKSLAN